jgi:hypothetical protein
MQRQAKRRADYTATRLSKSAGLFRQSCTGASQIDDFDIDDAFATVFDL